MSTYEKYILANNALRECFEDYDPKSYEELTPFEQEQVCKEEKETVAEFLKSGALKFSSLVQERIDILDKQV